MGDIFGDIFGDMFGGGRRRGGRAEPQEVRGRNVQIKLEMSLEEAVRGAKKKVKVKTYVKCETCGGSGLGKDGKKERCAHCHGEGQILMRQGFMQISQTCPYCQGTGYTITNGCKKCSGTGRTVSTKTVEVEIPAGVSTGDRIRLAGQGEAGMNGAGSGDLFVIVDVRDHEIFERDGNDLRCELPISFATAALGGKVEVPTLEGPVSISIRPETQTGQIMRIPGKGVRSYGSHVKGNLYCKIVVETPVNLTEHQKDLLKQFEASINGEEEVESKSKDDDSASAKSKEKKQTVKTSHKPKADKFFDGVKKFFKDLSEPEKK